ncbi:acyl-CoA thioesterase-2 [Novosphingobium kunmingense]|uniref:Acyl-CoA thioesterase 2 n=1 Tax=Novosphingobium kunmingense TaxID=1211806 RepID=A0A2N0I3U9_9SPHN|nr:acyl-CoA thioesterase II [Novosphingobium kunmingense]PKB25826.1 acyl-CoA thioesterase-2 [Novosphingobium kunmingense]
MDETITPERLVSGLVKLLEVKPQDADTFTGRRKRGGVGRVFGGQVIAQALAAAETTVDPDRPAHSLHAYFLRGGSEDFEIDYAVARDFDGGSFSNRRVVASQQGRPILNLTASFQKHEDGLHHVDSPMPEVPPPEDLEPEVDVRRRFADQALEGARHQFLAPRPVEMRAVEGRHWSNPEKAPPRSHAWFRTVAALPDDPRVHRAVLAFASDMGLLGTCALPHGLSWARGEVISASLDHAVWFHEPFRVDEWLLYATDSPWSGSGRGFNRGRVFSRDGRLVASVAQEGMIRRAKPKD